MQDIVGFGTCVPRHRLARDVMARQWAQPSPGGEKAVAGHDEDSLTLAVIAASRRDGGARVSVPLTDVDADRVEVEWPVELTFRRVHAGAGIQNHFRKARPAA